MAEKDSVTENVLKVRRHHKQGYSYMNNALELEEKEDSILPDFKYALRLYGQGISEFKEGIGINLKGSGEEYDKARRLQEKMESNISLASSRVTELNTKVEGIEREIESKNKETKDNKKPVTNPSNSEVKKTVGKTNVTGKPVNCTSSSVTNKKPVKSYVPPSKVTKKTSYSAKPAQKSTTTINGKTTIQARNGETDVHKKISNLKNIDKKHANVILDEVLEQGKGVSFDDIGGMQNAKKILNEIVILPASRPELFTGLRAPARGLLLFGPPGNGKTLLAKALATEAKAVFFNISAASLTSKFIGEGEKLVRAMFAVARELQPAIIFIDEIDSLLCERKENEHEASRRLKTEFLVGFDGVISDAEERILVMGATNRPWELDDAALRRMVKRVYVPLPDSETRKDILKKNMKKQSKVTISDNSYNQLSRLTEGYSGSDLTALAREAALMPIRDYTAEQLMSIPADKVRGISPEDFVTALKAIRPSVSPHHLGKFEEWNKTYGTLS